MAVGYLQECDDRNNKDIFVSDYNEASGDIHLLLHESQRLSEETSTGKDANIAFEQAEKNANADNERSCASCSKKVRVENVSSLRKGQHISMPGQYATKLRIYQHHAIIKKIRHTSETSITMEVIHFYKKGMQIKIEQSDIPFDPEHDELYITEYLRPRYDADEIVQRAESMLPINNDGQHIFGTYFPFTNNCEHFATWCVVGEKESLQCQTLRKKCINIFLKAFDFVGTIHDEIFLEYKNMVYLIYCNIMTVRHWNEFRKEGLCKTCLKRELKDLWKRPEVFDAISESLFEIAFPFYGSGIRIVGKNIILPALQYALQWMFS